MAKISRLILILALGLVFVSSSRAQQPFVTDDSDTTEKGHFHFEFSNEVDWLRRSSFPNLRQNTASFELGYGLFDGVEIGVEVPLISIFNASGNFPRSVTGIGDTNVAVKYNFLKEREKSRWPAMAIGVNVEIPTGDTRRQLGSGLADLYINSIFQKTVTEKTKLRWNGGVLFSGNETTGVVGIRSRSTVFTGGVSVVKSFTPKLQLGAELTGAITKAFETGQGSLQTTVGGNYQFSKNATFDFGLITGKFTASPRVGVQVGVSIDF
ncbi:MAG TPA: transporter [Pyrinomonadaceae bacterium]|nr:transporter [Pyrinomonadaceae bacterium]